MEYYKKRKRFISLVCAISILFSMISIPADAAGANSVTASTNASVTQGNTAYCYVNIDSTESLAALDVTVHFDPAKVEITDVYNSVGCIIYDSVQNVDNIKFSYILDGKGTASKTRLFYFQYRVLSNAEPGNAYFDITVGDAYDSSLKEVAVSGSRCSFNIQKKVATKTCSVSASSTVSTAIGQEFSLKYQFSTNEIASGSAVINYDPELFEVVDVKNGAFLNNKVVDVNTDATGAVYIAFVGTQYFSSKDFLTVTFRTIKNVTEKSKIELKTTELIDKYLTPIACNGYSTTVNVAYDDSYSEDATKMRLDGKFSYTNKQITLVVTLEAGSRLGAGDFVIEFDPELVSYKSCTKGFSPSFFTVNDKNVDEGKLKFHIISLSDIVTEETVLTVEFDVIHPYGRKTAEFTLNGTGLTDSLTEKIVLNFINASILLEYWVTFCDEDGTVLKRAMYHYGDEIEAPEAPTKESDAYGTYTITLTQEMIDSFAIFHNIGARNEWEKDGIKIEAGRWCDMGYDVSTPAIVIESSAAAEKPTAPKTPFVDVPDDAYYADAVAWAKEKGVTQGTDDTHFSPGNPCTSAQVLTFLWRANGSPNVATTIPEYYGMAVAWASANGLMDGMEKTFAPGSNSPRADIVTYLYRGLAD